MSEIEFFSGVPDRFIGPLETIREFLVDYPELARKPLKGDVFGSKTYWEKISERFMNSRLPKAPHAPKTVPDPLIGIILESFFSVPAASIPDYQMHHSLSMAAENIIGDYLERYLASVVEPMGWIWCSGEIVQRVDFIRKSTSGEIVALQVKNRDNSENSSSSKIRAGTSIEKWHRTNSKDGSTNWPDFPDQRCLNLLTEQGFESFCREYVENLKR